ncbi:MAG: acyltransferase 3 domain [Planctomycetota bacterium]|nr:MAG: acyltransferase 3 domain [Planctomycetota bacterium]
MGAFRIILCWLVVVAHVDPATAAHAGPMAADAVRFGGPFAVFCFYAVSGYYMTLTLNSTYAVAGGLRAYYINRAIRILPLYLALLAACAPLVLANANPTRQAWSSLNGGSAAAAAAGQVVPLGQEAFHWLQIDGGSLSPTRDFRASTSPAWHLLILPTCWSLSVECWFYLFAPLLMRRGAFARCGIAAASLAVWGVVFLVKFPPDPWIFRFFPATLFFFMAGSLVRTLHEKRLDRVAAVARSAGAPVMLAVFFALPVAWRSYASGHPETGAVALLVPLYAIALVMLPLLFERSSSQSALGRFDRFLADLAYPIFLVHYPVLRLTGWSSPLAVLGVSAVAGAAVLLIVDRPLARFKVKPVP